MKNIIFIIILGAALGLTSCQKDSSPDKMTQEKKPVVYPTLDEASKNAKTSLIEIMKLQRDLKINIDQKELELSNPEGSVKHYMVNFDSFLSSDSTKALKDISKDEGITIVPFVYNKRVIATASINKLSDGWRVGGLFNNRITSSINNLQRVREQSSKSTINYFEVPNIDAQIYEVVSDSAARYFADYGTLYNTEKETSLPELMKVLKKDAAEFQRKFGKDLKDKKLVK